LLQVTEPVLELVLRDVGGDVDGGGSHGGSPSGEVVVAGHAVDDVVLATAGVAVVADVDGAVADLVALLGGLLQAGGALAVLGDEDLAGVERAGAFAGRRREVLVAADLVGVGPGSAAVVAQRRLPAVARVEVV